MFDAKRLLEQFMGGQGGGQSGGQGVGPTGSQGGAGGFLRVCDRLRLWRR